MGRPGFRAKDRGPPKRFSKGGPPSRPFKKGGPTSSVVGGIKKKPRDPNARNGIRRQARTQFTTDDHTESHPKQHQQQQQQQQQHQQKQQQKQQQQQQQRNLQRKQKADTHDEGSAGGASTRSDRQASAPKQRPSQEATPRLSELKEQQQQKQQLKQQQKQQQQQQKQQQQKDELSHAVFVRNLPFDADEASVSSLLNQFGSLKKIFLVKNEQGEGKGVAFVYFDDAASAQKAISASSAYESELNRLSGRQQKRLTHLLAAKKEEERQQQAEAAAACGSNLFFKGRRLQILPALNREQAKKATFSRQQERAAASASKRGVPLAFEGLPKKPFNDLTPFEENIANAAYEETKEKLKNPNIFVNKNRLCVRNLPSWVDANFLREKISRLLAPILKTHAASPTAAAAAAIAAAAAAAAAHNNEQQEQQQQQQQQQRSEGDMSNMKEWRQKASASITKVSIIREKRDKENRKKNSISSSISSSSGTPRRSLGFCFLDLNCDFAQTLQLVHAIRDSRGFFDSPVSNQRKDKERKPIVQFALEDARKVKIRTERIEAFAKLLKKRQEEKEGEENEKPEKKIFKKKKKKYSRGQRQREKRRQQRLAAEGAASITERETKERSNEKMDKKKQEQKQTKMTQREFRNREEKNSKNHSLLESPRFLKEHENSRRKRKKRKFEQKDKEDLEETALKKRIKQLLQGLKN